MRPLFDMSFQIDFSHTLVDSACDLFTANCIEVYYAIFSFSAKSFHAPFHLHRPYSFLIKIIYQSWDQEKTIKQWLG